MKHDVCIFTGLFGSVAKIPFISGGIQAGVPNDGQDFPAEAIDFNSEFVKHPDATFYARVDTDSMAPVGIQRGDLIVVDRAVEAKQGDVVVVFVEDRFRIGTLDLSERAQGHVLIRPAAPAAQTYKLPAEGFVEWGVVIWSIRRRA